MEGKFVEDDIREVTGQIVAGLGGTLYGLWHFPRNKLQHKDRLCPLKTQQEGV